MLSRIKEFGTKLFTRFRHRSFFIRLLATTMLAAFIPLTIVSGILVRRETDSVIRSSIAQMENVAETAASQFEEYVTGMFRISNKIQLAAQFTETALTGSIQNEMDALDLLTVYKESLPFAKDFALYLPSSDAAYCSTGKLHLNGMLQHYINMNYTDFTALLDGCTSNTFVSWDSARGNILYIYPIRSNYLKPPNRFLFFILTPDTIRSAMENLLMGHYEITRIETAAGLVIYSKETKDPEETDSKLINCTRVSTKGYSLSIHAKENSLQQSNDSIQQNARLITFISVLLCIMLMIFVVFFNYRPLANLVLWTRTENVPEHTPELDSLYSAYLRLSEEKNSLSYQLYEKNMLIADKLMENLLSGRKLSQGDLNLLHLNLPYYRVVCACLEDVGNVSSIISRNKIGAAIYAIEMYADRRLTFVCGCTNDSEAAIHTLSDILRKLLQSPTLPLGFSSAYSNPERLFVAYLEAGRALMSESPDPDRINPQSMQDAMYVFHEDPKTLEELTAALKSSDPFMIRYAEDTFTDIQSSAISIPSQRYACYQLIDLYRRLCDTVGIALDREKLGQILEENSISAIHTKFTQILEEIRQENLKNVSAAADTEYSSIMQFVRANYTNPDFSLNDVADHLNVSIYTASRVLKNITGVAFRKYLNDMRIERAKELLLTTELSIQEVAQQAGFSSTSYFIRIFKQTEEITPNSYRWEQNP